MGKLGRLLCGVLVGLVAVSCTTSGPSAFREPVVAVLQDIPEDMIPALQKSVWRLDIYSGSKYRGHGSCVVVRSEELIDGLFETIVLTAAHCVMPDFDGYVVLDEKGKIFNGSVMSRGKYEQLVVPGLGLIAESGIENDWALLRFKGRFGVVMSRVAKERAPFGLPVVVIGYSFDRGPISRGMVIEVKSGNRGLLHYFADTGPGSSGGAVIGLIGGKPTLLAVHTRGVSIEGMSFCDAGVPLEEIVRQGASW